MSEELRKLDNDIVRLDQKIKDLKEDLSYHQVKLRELRVERFTLIKGVQVGSKVRDPQSGKVYIVTDIDPWGNNDAWLKGHPLKKDGTPSKAVQHIHPWELVKTKW